MVLLAQPINIEPQLKEQYATFLAQGFTPFMSALKIWPNNNGYCSLIASTWPNDPAVVAAVAARKADLAPKPPTKDELAIELHTRAQNMEDDEYVKASRLIAEMLGHMPKAGDLSVNLQNNIINNRVMVVKDKGTDDEWEDKLRAQQAKLISDAS